MFWENLNNDEKKEYYYLLNITKKWIIWLYSEPKIKKFKKLTTIEFKEIYNKWINKKPIEPTNNNWKRYDNLAAKGWKQNEKTNEKTSL